MALSPPLPRAVCAFALSAAVLAPAVGAHSPHDVVEQLAVTARPGGPTIVFAKLQLTAKSLLGRSFDGGASWSITALPVAERDISRIVFSPAFDRDSTVLMSTTDMGLLLSHDEGATWTVLDGGGVDLRVLDCAFSVDYATDTTLYASTVTGVYVSTDDGVSWTPHTTGLVSNVVTRLAVVPGDGSQLFAGRTTLHHSSDGGLTWVPLNTFSHDIAEIAVSPGFLRDQTLVVGLRGGGVFTSTTGGATWNPMVVGLSDPFVNDVALGSDGTVFAVTEEDGCFRGPLDGAFTLSTAGFEAKSNLTTNHYRGVALGPGWPAQPDVWVAGFEGLYASADGGDVFWQKDVYSQAYNRQIDFPPDYAQTGRLFLVNYGGGLLVTPAELPAGPAPGSLSGGLGLGASGGPSGGHPPGGLGGARPSGTGLPKPQGQEPVHFETRSDGVNSIFGQSLAFSPQFATDDTLYYAQSTIFRSEDRGLDWTQVPNPPGVGVVRALALSPGFPADPTVWLGAGLGTPCFRSTDGGQTWSPMTNGLPSGPQPVEIIPSPGYVGDQTVYLASKTSGVFVSTDGGLQWAPASDGLGDLHVVAFTISPDFVTDATLFAGVEKAGLFRSTDGGANWQAANAGLPTDLPLSVERIALSPGFATDGTGFVVILAAGLFRTTDGGLSWQAVGAGLPPDAPRVVAVSPAFADDQTVMVSTHAWTWVSHDGGSSFTRLPGYTRFDDIDPHLHYELAGGADAAGPSADERPPLDDDLAAWLLADPCPGTGPTLESANDAGTSWPAEIWPAGSHGVGVTKGVLPGDMVGLDFFGDSVRWFAPRGPDQGLARVSIDGELLAIVDLYAPTYTSSVPVFARTFAQVGAHRLKVIVTGQKNPSSAGVLVRNDGFDVTY